MNFKEKVLYLKRIFKHKIAFAYVERKLLSKNTIRSLTHDIDKVPLILFTKKTRQEIQKIHKSKRKHHAENSLPRSEKDLLEMVVDWQCARLTKPDQQRDAVKTLEEIHPEMSEELTPLMIRLGLLKE